MSLNAADISIVEKAVQDTLKELEKYAPEEYAKLNADPEKKKNVTESARAAATEQVKLSKEFPGQPDDIAEQLLNVGYADSNGEEYAGQPDDIAIAERLAKHLPESRIKMLREGLESPIFRMDITKKSDGQHWEQLSMKGNALEPARVLGAPLDIDRSKITQWYTSILLDATCLVMSAVGISVSPSARAKAAA
jgi:hypothetical protein